jgi:hypothetical protein
MAVAVVVMVVAVVVPAATAEGGGDKSDWHPVFHINFAG